MKKVQILLIPFFLLGCVKSNDINIIYSSDMWGETSHCGCPGHPTGGIAKKSSFIREVRDHYKGVYYFEIGDAFFRPQIQDEQLKSELNKIDMFFKVFDRMGLDVFVPGEADLKAGVGLIRDRAKGHRFRVLLSNLVKKGSNEAVFDRMYIDTRYQRKVCAFALMGPDLFKDPGYSVLDPLKVTEEILSEFKKRGCEFNILLSHMGFSYDADFIKRVENSGLNLMIGSHDGGWMSSPRKEGDLLLVYGYRRGQAVGHIGFIGSLNTKSMRDATEAVESRETMKRFEAELKRLVEPARGTDPEVFFKNDSTTLVKIRMLKGEIDKLKRETESLFEKPYYFNRVVAMDSAYEEDEEVSKIVRAFEVR